MTNDCDSLAPDHNDDPLDRLLRQALWPEDADPLDKLLRMAQWPGEAGDLPTPSSRMTELVLRAASVVRARPQGKHTTSLRRPQKRKAWALGGVAVAAAVSLAAALCSRHLTPEKPSVGLRAPMAQTATPGPRLPAETPLSGGPVAKNNPQAIPEDVVQEAVIERDPSVLSRAIPPGELYRRMLMARNRIRSPGPGSDAIDRLLAERVAEPEGDLDELIEALVPDPAECEQRLLRRFDMFVGEQASAAVELLGLIGSEASVPLLLHLSHKPATHASAVRSLSKLADSRTLARLVLTEYDPDLREEMIAALRAREDQQTLVVVLAAEGEPLCREPRFTLWERAESL